MIKNLKAVRESRGLSQKELGNMIGVEQQTISGYESISDPSSDILCKLAKCLDTSTDYLLGLKENDVRTNAYLSYELSAKEDFIVREYRSQDELGKELIDNTVASLHKYKKIK